MRCAHHISHLFAHLALVLTYLCRLITPRVSGTRWRKFHTRSLSTCASLFKRQKNCMFLQSNHDVAYSLLAASHFRCFLTRLQIPCHGLLQRWRALFPPQTQRHIRHQPQQTVPQFQFAPYFFSSRPLLSTATVLRLPVPSANCTRRTSYTGISRIVWL